MADAQRLPVKRLVLHHAVTPLWSNKSKAELAQWFSSNGFAQAYGSNPANWSGLVNPFTGARSYSQTHAVGQRVTSATPDATAAERTAGYRVFWIVRDPWGQITWHAGNWHTNRESIGLENLGDYRDYPLRDGDCKVIADFWRAHDKKMNGSTFINLHNEIVATICPARVAESRNKIVNYINNPPKPPAPPAQLPNVRSYSRLPKKTYEYVRNAKLWDFNANSQNSMKAISSFKKGDRMEIVGKAVYKTGSEYYMTQYSFGNGDPTKPNFKPVFTRGVNKVDLKEYVAPKPPTPTVKPPVEPPVEPEVPSKDDEQDKRLTALEKAVKAIQDTLKTIIEFFTNLGRK